jgi:hypothetical protein
VSDHTALVTDDLELIVDNGEELQRDLQRRKGRRVVVRIDLDAPKRSCRQNRYFHGPLLKALCEHTGYEPDEMKDYLKWKFLRTEDEMKPRDTSSLSTKEFEDLNKTIREWASRSLGCYIPLPNEKPLKVRIS